MLEQQHDLWGFYSADAVVVTTNGTVKGDGNAVMGRGCAREAAAIYPILPAMLGSCIKREGNKLYCFSNLGRQPIVCYPVKNEWMNIATIELIKISAIQLVELTDKKEWEMVVMPRPGCGNGGLHWSTIKPILQPYLDDRFIVCHK